MVWDYTCSDTLAACNINSSCITAGAVAEKAFRAKEAKYEALSAAYNFVPVAMETAGPYAADSLQFIREVGKRLAEKTGETRSASFLLQGISIAVQRANSLCVLGTIPPSKNLSEVFYLL